MSTNHPYPDREQQLRSVLDVGPPINCLCGSTQFKELFEHANEHLTLSGDLVLSVGFFGHVDGMPDARTKERLDELHLWKIQLADRVTLVSPRLADGLPYVGESTVRELVAVRRNNKDVWWFSGEGEAPMRAPLNINPWVLRERPENIKPEETELGGGRGTIE